MREKCARLKAMIEDDEEVVREQMSFACGCVFYREHTPPGGEPSALPILPVPCEDHAGIIRLPVRTFNRVITWPPTEIMLERAARRGDAYS